jgi:aryl-phospho-beta-D-glucosidase BglC (GH1 family)
MKNCPRIPLLFLALALCLLPGGPLWAATGFVHTRGQQLVTPDGKTLLLRGTNLGNWLEPEGYMFHFDGGPQSPREIEQLFNELIGPVAATKFWQQYRQNYITEPDVAFLHQAGFNVVRVPMHYKFFESDPSEGFALMDQLVQWCRRYHLYIILDMHCAPGGQTGANIDDSWNYPWLYESPEEQQRLITIWQRIAHHYSNEPTILGYDLLNEPIANFPEIEKYNKDLEPIYKRVTAAIRQVDTHHVVILGGAQWDGNFSIFGPPFDKNVMYTFHQYWMPPTQDAVQKFVDFRARYNVPVWLGESGENTDAWVRQYRELLEKNQIGWTFWPYKKMDATSSPVSFNRPPHWDEIIAFAKHPLLTGDAKQQIAGRPSLADSREALQAILENVKFANCRVNSGYLEALGLRTPAK